MGVYNAKYSAMTAVLVCMLFWSGCQSTGKKYVEQQEFDVLSRRVDSIETQVNALVKGNYLPSMASGSAKDRPALQTTAVAATADEKIVYQKGQSLLKQKKYDQAAIIFRQMLARNPQGKLAPNARYWLGECHYASGRYAEAAVEFQRCAADYPRSNKAPDSLLKLSFSYDRLNQGHQAMAALDQLFIHYPNSSSADMIKRGRGKFKI